MINYNLLPMNITLKKFSMLYLQFKEKKQITCSNVAFQFLKEIYTEV